MSASFDRHELTRSICRESFEDFCKTFWTQVPGAGEVVWGWHMSVLCRELQAIAERVFQGLPRLYDCIFNVSPGTSKSTLSSILFPAWVWTRMTKARIICASHTDTLVLDFAVKARYVIQSDLYQACFPEVEISSDQGAKHYYTNTCGGDRFSCTVAGKSPTGFHGHFLICDDLLDPKKAVSEAELKIAQDFVDAVLPGRKVDKQVSVTFLIAQRLHEADPPGHLLDKAKKAGAAPVRHICLPAELPRDERTGDYLPANTNPPELAKNYVDGLMDPVRLPRKVLMERKTDGEFSFAGQFLQNPVPLSGGIFKEEYFTLIEKVAPFHAKRVLYVDRASTPDESACATAMVLMAKDADNRFFVEDCVHGYWEPFKRNQILLATAQSLRARYGPHNDPWIYIEAEGGASGKEAFMDVARLLAGFKVREHKIAGMGDKAHRAEPWSSMLAARNVWFTNIAGWDFDGYKKEHCLFPRGRLKDRVDASAGAFCILVKMAVNPVTLRTYQINSKKKDDLKIVLCTKEDLSTLVVEKYGCLLITINDPLDLLSPLEQPEANGLQKLLGHHSLSFADIEPAHYQDKWDENIPAYNAPPAKVVLSREATVRLWAFITRVRDVSPRVIVLVAPTSDDRRGRSVACALADALRLVRGKSIYIPSDPEGRREVKAENQYVYDLVRSGRSLVV